MADPRALEDEDVVIQSAAYDGLGRRIRKTVTNSGDLDGVTVYLYQGQQIIETRDGSGNVETQVYHGTRYIDEVVGLRLKDVGRVYLHQDANWNVTAMTDLTGRVLERYWYSPYGELEAVVAAHPFDYDDDGDVDADDYAVTTNGTCAGSATGDCRRLDADADGVVSGADQAVIAAYVATLDADTELQRVPAATHSRRGNVYGHQGLVLDAEIASYQNRARQYAPGAKRFMQRDPARVRDVFGERSRPNEFRDGLNFYSAYRNSPCSRLDPHGLCTCTERAYAKLDDCLAGSRDYLQGQVANCDQGLIGCMNDAENSKYVCSGFCLAGAGAAACTPGGPIAGAGTLLLCLSFCEISYANDMRKCYNGHVACMARANDLTIRYRENCWSTLNDEVADCPPGESVPGPNDNPCRSGGGGGKDHAGQNDDVDPAIPY